VQNKETLREMQQKRLFI